VLLAFACTRVHAAAPVYIIDVHGEVWSGQADLVKQGLDDAAKAGASAVILDVDTDGGVLDSANDIQKAIYAHDSDFPIVGYVHDKAFSSGSLITLSCKVIAMAPGATFGSALPHPGPTSASPDPELLQAVQNMFRATAERRGRNQTIAAAMVTANDPIPSLGVKAGDILTLTTNQAKANGFCDVVAPDYPAIMAYLGVAGAPVVHRELSDWQVLAQEITTPLATILLVAVGLALVIFELVTLHTWGVAGILGGIMIGIVFIAHIAVGMAGWIGLIVFIAGILFLLFETHVFPGHGLAALAGLICIFMGMFYALGGTNGNAAVTVSVSILVTVGFLIAFFMYLPRSRVWRKMGQSMQQKASEGYVASQNYTEFVGLSGVAVTLLRPAGIAEVDGARLNVVTTGELVQPGSPVEVITVQGNRIVVRALPQTVEPTPNA
jgi:membrane-bound serine protease (ClpP class)